MTAVDLLGVPRVLIAESDPWIRETLSDLVLSVRDDVALEICTDGKQAVEWMKKQVPDLIIAARELPAIDGLSLLRGVRKMGRQPPVPFILLSSRSDSASVREVLPLAPTAYLTKPLNNELLLQRLRGLLVECSTEGPSMQPGMTLARFIDKRRETADSAPLCVNVEAALQLSRSSKGVDIHLLEQELRNDPHITAVLIAAANTAAQHLGKPVQSLGPAMDLLGATQSAQIVAALGKKRVATLTHDGLLARANELWLMSQRTADYARILGRMLELNTERCFSAGLLQSLGELAVIGCMQEWLFHGGKLDDDSINLMLEQYSAAFGSALRTRWRLPLELRELIAAVYQYNTGIFTREVLAMNLAGEMARLSDEQSVNSLVKSKSARLLKLSVADLQRLRKKLTGVVDPSLLAIVQAAQSQEEQAPIEDDLPDLLDLTPEPEPLVEDIAPVGQAADDAQEKPKA